MFEVYFLTPFKQMFCFLNTHFLFLFRFLAFSYYKCLCSRNILLAFTLMIPWFFHKSQCYFTITDEFTVLLLPKVHWQTCTKNNVRWVKRRFTFHFLHTVSVWNKQRANVKVSFLGFWKRRGRVVTWHYWTWNKDVEVQGCWQSHVQDSLRD